MLIEMAERAYFAKLATQAKSDTTNLSGGSIFNSPPADPGWALKRLSIIFISILSDQSKAEKGFWCLEFRNY